MAESRVSRWTGWLWAAMHTDAPEGRVPPALFLHRTAALSWVRAQPHPESFVIRKTEAQASFDRPGEEGHAAV